MNEISLNLKDKTQSLVRRMSLYKWGAGFALVLLVGPLMWMMATALLGLAAAGISAAVLALVIIGIVEYLPVVIAKIQNHKMTLLREEAKNEISYQEIGKFAALWEMALASADWPA